MCLRTAEGGEENDREENDRARADPGDTFQRMTKEITQWSLTIVIRRVTNNFQTVQQFEEATAFVVQQFFWRSEFSNRPIIHYQNKIRVQDRVEAVGNRDYSALLKLRPQHFLSTLGRVKYW